MPVWAREDKLMLAHKDYKVHPGQSGKRLCRTRELHYIDPAIYLEKENDEKNLRASYLSENQSHEITRDFYILCFINLCTRL